jgi:hypothetical protein
MTLPLQGALDDLERLLIIIEHQDSHQASISHDRNPVGNRNRSSPSSMLRGGRVS